MKKSTFLLINLLFLLSKLAAKDYSDQLFKNFVNEKDKYYEFYIQNPFFMIRDYDLDFCIADINAVKNKIIKVYKKDYVINKDGSITNGGDNDEPDVICAYYFFDNEGHITDFYNFDYSEKGSDLVEKRKSSYSCNSESYNVVYQIDRYRIGTETQIRKYNIKEQNNKLYLEYYNDDQSPFETLVFEKGKVLKEQENNYFSEYKFQDDYIERKTYYLDDKTSKNYRNLNTAKKYKYTEFYYERWSRIIIFNDDFTLGTEVDFDEVNGKRVNEKPLSRYERKENPAGFTEYEEKTPYEGKTGSYTYIFRYLLDEPDDFFIICNEEHLGSKRGNYEKIIIPNNIVNAGDKFPDMRAYQN